MCGIAGILNVQPDLPAPKLGDLNRMTAALRHRGPDAFGVYRARQCGLASARLAIIDVAGGSQPVGNEDGTVWTVFNGELFNYLELRAELTALGHVFRTKSDTEVIVHAWEAWGEEAFGRFNGQFAIALWDEKKEALVLARDPLGVTPLYLALHGGRLYFASEVKAIFAAATDMRRALDPVGLDQTFTFWTVVPPQTVFEGVRELEPGHVRVHTKERVRDRAFFVRRYPIEREGEFKGSLDDAAKEVRSRLEASVHKRLLLSDVPVGSYLSGGLDSALVAALALRAKGQSFATFSLRFEDAEYDETPFQRELVRQLKTEHHELVVSRGDIARAFPDVVRHAERPMLRTAPAPLYLLSQLVRDAGIKVVLTGEGADEFFAGYDLFREAKVRRFWAAHPDSEWRHLLLQRLYPYLARSPVSQQAMAKAFFGQRLNGAQEPGFAHDLRWRTTGALKRLFSRDVREAVRGRDVTAQLIAELPDDFSRWSLLAQDQYLEIKTLLSGYLLSTQGDRMLMSHSVEGRFPFLDPEVTSFADTLPPSYKLRVLDEKHVLKRVAEDLVPAAIRTRKKQPYRAPDALAFVGYEAPPWIDDAMSDEAIASAGVFDVAAVAQLWKKLRKQSDEAQFSNADNMAIVGVLSTQLLHSQFIAALPSDPSPVRPTTCVDRVPGQG